MNTKEMLLPFYFGSLNEEQRLVIERQLLTDEETLVDYLDLKRSIEGAALEQQKPSVSLWQKLKPKEKKKFYISLAFGSAVAAGLLAFLLLNGRTQPVESMPQAVSNILFDSSSELPASSDVL